MTKKVLPLAFGLIDHAGNHHIFGRDGNLEVNITENLVAEQLQGGLESIIRQLIADGDLVIDDVNSAQRLTTPRTFTITGDGTSTPQPFDGTENVTMNFVLAEIPGLTAGIFTKVGINTKGQVVSAEQLTADDIPMLTMSRISDAGTAATLDVGTAPGNIPLIGPNGLLPSSILPATGGGVTMVEVEQAISDALAWQPII